MELKVELQIGLVLDLIVPVLEGLNQQHDEDTEVHTLLLSGALQVRQCVVDDVPWNVEGVGVFGFRDPQQRVDELGTIHGLSGINQDAG